MDLLRFESLLMTLGLVVIILNLCGINSAQGQDYILTGPADTRYIPNYQQHQNQYINNQNIIPFRQVPQGFQDSYLPQRDLQTSDLPVHLQQTLPQYRFTTKPPPTQFNYQAAPQPTAFRPQPQQFQNVIPSTHRPNYSHLFAQNHHNHDPSQTETFLGEITLQNPVEFPPRFGNFKPSQKFQDSNIDQNLDFQEQPKQTENAIQLGSRPNILNHRTRIFAPSESSEKTRTQVKDYFVNNNGDVFITTKTPFSPKPTPTTNAPTTVERKNPFVPTPKPTGKPISFNVKPDKKPFVPKTLSASTTVKNSFDLDSLLEEPIKETDGKSNDDEVEVINSVPKETGTTEPFDDYEYEVEPLGTHPPNTEYHDSEELEKDTNDVNNEEYIDEEEEEVPNEKEHIKTNLTNLETNTQNSSAYEVLTMKPSPMVKDDNFKEFVDTIAIDTTTEETPTTIDDISEETISPVGNKEDLTTKKTKIIEQEEEKHDEEDIKSEEDEPEEKESEEREPEVVVSVVTTKSVINNTIVASATPIPLVTEKMTPNPKESDENTTDAWVVVASVQTSRSVSGARYLPSSIVEQEERIKLLNEHSEEDETEEQIETTTIIVPTSTTTKHKTSTESLTDKLDRVQSDLSSGLLTGGFKNGGNNIAVINENMQDITTIVNLESSSTTTKSPLPPVNIRKFSPHLRSTTTARPKHRIDTVKQDDLSGLLPPGFKPKYQNNRKTITTTTTTVRSIIDEPQNDQPAPKIIVQDVSAFLPPSYKKKSDDKENKSSLLDELLSKIKPTTTQKPHRGYKPKEERERDSILKGVKEDDISAFLPPGYKPPKTTTQKPSTDDAILSKIKPVDDVSALLPPGYKSKQADNATSSILSKAKPVDDISSLLPPGYKPNLQIKPVDDISSLLPPGYKPNSEDSIPLKVKPVDDISSLLPPGYKPKSQDSILSKAKPVDDISSLLPPGYKRPSKTNSDDSQVKLVDDISALLPPGYKSQNNSKLKTSTEGSVQNLPPGLLPPGYKPSDILKENTTDAPSSTEKPASGSGFKVVFPSRPGGGVRKSSLRTTTRSYSVEETPKPTSPTIHKGWPSRATTEFTGWPTPSTTPISIEKLLEAARTASTSSSTAEPTPAPTKTTTTTTTTTTTQKPTTPGVCTNECDLAGTIKLVGGAKWVPELLDRNTKEWQILANEVQSQLDEVFSKSSVFNRWYKKIRIDGFSKGSVLVDYLVELNDLGRQVNTMEMKKIFHESLNDALKTNSNREGKSLNETMKLEGKLALGNFVVDPKYTDFIVLPKQMYPTVGYAEDNVLLPQWAIAVIVIGLASLLFVIIFGVTVLVNRQKNAKKKAPTPLTEDMLNELNKNHMGGFDNYGADDLYNMEDVWNDRGYDQKPPKKRSSGSIHDNSMSNLYDSWRSEWNGYYYNAYYGNNPGSSHGGAGSAAGYGRRRSDYDTNF